MAKKCLLHCLTGSHNPILLNNNDSTIIGRSTKTKIKDKRCSKEQIELTANYDNYTVNMKQLGTNSCGWKGRCLETGETVQLHHGDTFEILFNKYSHKILFEPDPPTSFKRESEKEETSTFPFKLNGEREETSTFPFKLESTNKTSKMDLKVLDHSERKRPRLEEGKKIWEILYDKALVVLNRNHGPGSQKIASYDIDGTLIATASGRVFAKDYNDWKILYPEVPNKLKSLCLEGYKIVLFTNQAGIARGKQTIEGIQKKIERIMDKMGIDAQVLISTGKGIYRKPIPGMWDFFVKECNDGVLVDKSVSFFVGDAAGRPEVPKVKKKDHSSSDRLFSLNIGLPFYTPEEHFKGQKPSTYVMPDFIPSSVDASTPLYNPVSAKVPNDPLEVILMVGFPGSGKSTFVENHILKHGYVAVNRDTLGSWQKCIAAMENAIKNGKRVVIDNTNPDRESRAKYVQLAKKLNVSVRCFVLEVSLDQAKHNNKFRELTRSNHVKVSDMIYNMYKSKYEPPTIDEGFSELVKVNFVPLFKNEENEKLYKLFLL